MEDFSHGEIILTLHGAVCGVLMPEESYLRRFKVFPLIVVHMAFVVWLVMLETGLAVNEYKGPIKSYVAAAGVETLVIAVLQIVSLMIRPIDMTEPVFDSYVPFRQQDQHDTFLDFSVYSL